MTRIEKAEYLIAKVYDSPDGSVGGYGHIVFDDDNIDNGFIDSCLEHAINDTFEWCGEETRIASIIALTAFSMLSIEEREIVVERYRYVNGVKGLNEKP